MSMSAEMNAFDAIVVGAGLSGAVMAERMASQLGWRVLLLEQRAHLGGNCYDEFDAAGVLIHKYGPHLFHTDKQQVWDYLSQFTQWRPYEHRVLSQIDGQLLPIPFNLTSIRKSFAEPVAEAMVQMLKERFGEGARVPILQLRQEQEPLLQQLAEFIYQRAFVNYTSKQWGVGPEAISPAVTARVPVVISEDDRYFTDPWQAVPLNGYTSMISNMLSHPGIDLQLSAPMHTRVQVDWSQRRILLDGQIFHGPLIYCGMIDQLLPESTFSLPYRSLRFEHKYLQQEWFQPATTVNYPNEQAYTRITEFKHLTGQHHSGTSITYEYPCDYKPEQGLEPYYPIFTDSAQQQYQQCVQRLCQIPQIIALGRLAEYRYFDMDDAVDNALGRFADLQKSILSKDFPG
jgi:UDP-galactopyranose mutase